MLVIYCRVLAAYSFMRSAACCMCAIRWLISH